MIPWTPSPKEKARKVKKPLNAKEASRVPERESSRRAKEKPNR